MANTKVVIDLEVTDKGLVATFNKTTKALVTLNAAQKEKLNLQKKLRTAGTKYLASQEEESRQIVRINKETAENNRIAGISVKRKLDNRKAMEQAAYWASKEGIEYKKNVLLMREAAKQAELTAIRQIQSSKKTISEGVANSAMGLDEMKTTAGLSGAIVTEMGRTISDAPYGLKGMGNNISQLSSLFGMFAVNVKKSGRTMKQGFKQLGASLMGPIGIVTALQLIVALIQSGAFDFLADWFTDIKNKVKEVNVEVATQAEELRGYVSVLNDSNASEAARINASKELVGVIGGVTDATEVEKMTNEELTKSVEDYIAQQFIRAELDAELDASKEIYAERERVRRVKAKIAAAETKEEQLAIYKANSDIMDVYFDISKEAMEGSGRNLLQRLFGSDENLDYVGLFEAQSKGAVDEYDAAVQRVAAIELKLKALRDKNGGGGGDPKVFKAKQLELAKLREKFRQEAESAEEVTREQAIQKESDFAKAELEIRRQSFVDKEKARLKAFQKGKDLSQEQIDTIESQAKAETELVIAQIDIRTQAQLAALKIITDAEAAEIKKRFDQQLDINSEQNDAYNAQRQAQFFNGAVTEQIMQAEVDTVNYENKKAQLDRALLDTEENTAERSRIQGQMVLLDKQRGDQVLDNDQKVQNAKLKLANRGAAVLADILGKETKAGKAVAATMATINTYQAVSNALKTGVAPFKYIDAGITAAQGFMQVKNILKTKSPKTSGDTGGAAAAATVQPPSFNIVGGSGVNQLADVIAGQEDKPLRTYVVASDVSTAQELDRNIIESASL